MKVWEFDPGISSVKDWRNKYSGCIVLVGSSLCKVDANDGLTIIGPFSFHNHELPEDFQISMIRPWLPDSQWILLDNKVPVFLRRLPAKQWHRSFCMGMYSGATPYIPGHSLRGWGSFFSDTNRLHKALCSPTYRDLKDAISFIDGNKEAVGDVLSPSFALIRNDEVVYSLYSSMGLVGLVNKDTQVITVTAHLVQEVQDLLKGNTEWHIRSTRCL